MALLWAGSSRSGPTSTLAAAGQLGAAPPQGGCEPFAARPKSPGRRRGKRPVAARTGLPSCLQAMAGTHAGRAGSANSLHQRKQLLRSVQVVIHNRECNICPPASPKSAKRRKLTSLQSVLVLLGGQLKSNKGRYAHCDIKAIQRTALTCPPKHGG